MSLKIEHGQLPKEVKEVIFDEKKKCVAFIGSGLSNGYYSWLDLVNLGFPILNSLLSR